MPKGIIVTGGAGELGSNFAKLCVDKGFPVKIIDIVRFNEAWRLKWLGIEDKVHYIWKSTFDLTMDDLNDSYLILDCACQPDRPLGTSSPTYTLVDNLFGATRLLELVSKTKNKPYIVYPSSCNVFLGVPPAQQPLTEDTKPMPTNYYGWSKLAAEELYLTYYRAYELPVFVIRTGSCYGAGMRTDQMVAKCILNLLKGNDFIARSPGASRTYTYSDDVMIFYDKFLDRIDSLEQGRIIHNGGNKENKPYTTIEMANLIKRLTKSNADVKSGEYEIGEQINTTPVMQWESSLLADNLIGWTPNYSTIDGLKNTINWFKERLGEYI